MASSTVQHLRPSSKATALSYPNSQRISLDHSIRTLVFLGLAIGTCTSEGKAAGALYLYQHVTNAWTFGQPPPSGNPEGPRNTWRHDRAKFLFSARPKN
jgi:hypothetical protein